MNMIDILLTLPFIGLLLSISFGPLLFPRFWHKKEKFIIIFFAIIALVFVNSWKEKFSPHPITHMILFEYLPFVCLLGSIFTVNSGLFIDIKMTNSPLKLSLFLSIAGICSNILGTMGASLLFLRPFIRILHTRLYQKHCFVFFIFIVSNVSGCLTPIGDPPLFIGYLKGIDFFWPLCHLYQPFLFTTGFLLILFFFIDRFFWNKERQKNYPHTQSFFSIRVEGKRNIFFIITMIGVLLSTSHIYHKIDFLSFKIPATLFYRDMSLLFIAFLSYFFTPREIHKKQHFSFKPIEDILFVFFSIFITLIPVSSMLQQGHEGPFAPFLSLIESTNPSFMYFWTSGFFSSFLDNAPTYLVFFNLSGGNPTFLMNEGKHILAAISLGSVFMGAMTYIGNAPNMMVKSLAQQHGIKMPSFIAYIGYSLCFLLPVFMLVSFIFL